MRPFGRLGGVSALSFGGGGIGNVWGAVDRQEAQATVRAAVDAGITLIDLAPTYGPGELSPEAELVVGDVFNGRVPEGVLVTTKVVVDDDMPRESMPGVIRGSLQGSLDRLRLNRIDVFLLHSYVRPPGVVARGPDVVEISSVRDTVRPVFERLDAEGLIGAWGLTGAAHPDAICDLLGDDAKPDVVQCVTNALESADDMWPFDSTERPDHLRVRTVAASNGVAVMGIRAAAAGALTDAIDREVSDESPVAVGYRRARRFRLLSRERGVSAAHLAHRYALSQSNVATVVIGAKNRHELAEALAAEAAGPLTPDEMRVIEDACAVNEGVRS
jgi:aryl-alcohol dehydrogenase-like predicted oxidoreductase